MVIKLCTQNTLQLIATKIFHTDRRRGKKDRIVGTKVDWGLNNVTFESRHEVKENRDIHGGCFVLFSSSCFFFPSLLSPVSFFFKVQKRVRVKATRAKLILKGRENKKQRTFTCCFA